MPYLPVDRQRSIHCWGFLMGSPSVLLPAFQTSSVLLFAEKDKWLWRECTFVRIFIVLLCVLRDPAGKVEEFMELCFQEGARQVAAPCSEGRGRGGQGRALSLILSAEVISDLGGFRGREKRADPSPSGRYVVTATGKRRC